MATERTSTRKRSAGGREDQSETVHNNESYDRVVYLTKSTAADRWYFWNTGQEKLSWKVGDCFEAIPVSSCMSALPRVTLKSLVCFSLQASASKQCVKGESFCFVTDDRNPNDVLSQKTLLKLCREKGVSCPAFLDTLIGTRVNDPEAQAGEQLYSLFTHSVSRMLENRYDIMHHYPLFSRALGLYYSNKTDLLPVPDVQSFVKTDGILATGAKVHEKIHGVPLTGTDRETFSRWNVTRDTDTLCAPARTDLSEQSGEKGTEKEETCPSTVENVSNLSLSGGGERVAQLSSGLEAGKDPQTKTTSASSTGPVMSVADRVAKFNNLNGTLTDRYAGKRLYIVHASESVTFDDLVNYCVTAGFKKQLQGLPLRKSWGAVNPVLLMEDAWDSAAETVRRRYVITSRGYLASMESGAVCYYNEVFLPGRSVSRLNLDVDLKCCATCKDDFSAKASKDTKYDVAKIISASAIAVITESLILLTKKQAAAADIAKALGKVSAYMRAPSTSGSCKISLRLLWYLPIELCSAKGISAYDALLRKIEQVSLSHVILSYKKEQCGLCQLKADKAVLRSKLSDVSSRRSAVDKAPYVIRKCVRLPNCYKEETRFEYIGTFNRPNVPEPGNETVHSIAVGLSSNPVQLDVTTLGSDFDAKVLTSSDQRTGFKSVTNSFPNEDRVQKEAERLSDLWDVPVTVHRSSDGLYIVQASEKSGYPCPICKYIHSKFLLRAIVFAHKTIPKCFVEN